MLVLVVGTITYMCLDVPIYVETLGLVALLCEAMLGVPQFYRNFMKKSTQGMRYVLALLVALKEICSLEAVFAKAAFWLICGK